MAKEVKTAAVGNQAGGNNDNSGYIYQNRRYVGTKETVAYIVYDMSQSFNINTYSGRFVTNILQISLRFQRIIDLINGIWDVVNDVLFGAIVDKTRTRWGKFKPYLVALGIPGTIGTCLFWMLPLFFHGSSSENILKFIVYLLLAVVREGAGTFRGIAQNGIRATITPHPVDRTRLITIADFVSGALGEKLPEQIMTVMLDLISRDKINISYEKMFVGMGLFTAIVAGAGALWFFLICKERVMQSVETPSVKASIKSIINNKPILLMTLSQILGSFAVGGSKQDYYIDVLNFASLGLITGIPGAIINPFSYMAVPWFRRHFSSRFLYIIGNKIDGILLVPVFLVGCIGGKKHGLYKNIWVMGIAMMLWETIFMIFYGVRRIIPTEMYNEAMDYCEWKNGYRTEGMTSVAQGLASKLASIFSRYISNYIKQLIGYDLTRYVRGTAQTDETKFGLFAMFTIVPFLTGMVSIIPMLFYDLSGKKKEKMYEELLERRAAMSKEATSGDLEALERLAKAQMEIGNMKQEL